ncbi:D-alanine--D-alanine ligase family protein [Aeromicrobium halocynthiae]|uniref:D-alanine--D-alanine ligase family protein n=1 Tax=Aeromicrobium halocynthiae TaxID=560557 RepID=UPI0031E14E31
MSPSSRGTADRPRLAVVFGGRSSEHEVSCLTARNVVAVVDREAFDVLTVGITTDGAWVRDPMDWDGLEAGTLPSVAPDLPPFSWDDLRDVDVVFPLLHGPWGEDGTIQGLLEMAGVRYVGAGVLASAAGMDKPFTKSLFSAGGLPQVPHVTVLPQQWADPAGRERVLDRVRALGMPVFVKPSRAGSSSGVTKVDHADDLEAAVESARAFDPKVVVEAAARGKRELEVGVIQRPDGTPWASVVGEVVQAPDSQHAFYDFEAKYLDGTSSNVVPADVPDSVAEQVRTYAVQAFAALGCEGLARVDFFLTDDGLVINEINTMPGFTSTSMFPVLWQATGVDYAELVGRLLDLALERPVGLR